MDSDSFFCISPWTMVYAHDNGKYAPCNFAVPDEHMGVDNTSITEWMQSDKMNQLRSEMLDPNSDHKLVNQVCQKCKFDEERYDWSRRLDTTTQAKSKKDYWGIITRCVELSKAAGYYDFDERILEIQLRVFGSKCNLDCYMCHHFSSTTRQKMAYDKGVWNDTVWYDMDRSKKLSMTANLDKVDDNVVINQIIELAPYVKTLKIIGGEPLVMKQYYSVLDRLVQSGESKNIIIKYQTNLTKLKNGKHNFLNYIPHFKKVLITVSIDAVGKYNDYIRRRSSFQEIEENIKACSVYDNVVINLNSTLSVPGILRFHEIDEYTKNNPHINGNSHWLIKDPKQLRINNLPKPLKDKLISYYKDNPKYADVVKALELPEEDDANFKEICNYLMKGDEAYRGTKWEMELFDIFPELKEYYNVSE
jgi:sulfatase maturation enzyme AslB (radical SAM superfamily)